MSNPKFDINDGDFIFGDDNFGIDSNGHIMIEIGENTMMDTQTGEIHFTIGDSFGQFDDDDDDD